MPRRVRDRGDEGPIVEEKSFDEIAADFAHGPEQGVHAQAVAIEPSVGHHALLDFHREAALLVFLALLTEEHDGPDDRAVGVAQRAHTE